MWSYYPYNFGSLASITGSTANSSGYYYFYYDIEMAANVTPNVVSICDGNSVTVGTNTYTTGIYYDTLDAANFCDSIIYTNLTVNQPLFHQLLLIRLMENLLEMLLLLLHQQVISHTMG